MKGCTQLTWPYRIYRQAHSIVGITAFAKAGLLALGSFYSLRRPVSFKLETVALQILSPITAAGPLPILTGFPIKPYGTLRV